MIPQNQNPNLDTGSALVTGAAGGLGKAFAVECARRGWDLYLTDLSAPALETLAAGLRAAYGVQVRQRPCDLTSAEERSAFFQNLEEEKLTFHTLINVAGGDFEGPFLEQSRQRIRTLLRLNIEGTLELTHALLHRRDPRRPFHILNTASLAAFYPMPVKASYAASKRFLLDFSLALREELRGLGATVTVLCPAGMPTTPETIEAIDAQGWAGLLTTRNTGSVAAQALNAAMRGQAVVVPGAVNQFLRLAGGLLPPRLLAWMIGSRWRLAWQRRREAAAQAAAWGAAR